MAVSIPRPDPSSPDDVAAASFSVARRGYDQAEVKDLLRMVAAELARSQERERTLERELRAAQRATTNPAVALDEEVVTRLLGEEAARILSTARDAASQIKIRAEENAAQLLREASDEAQRLREDASLESARRRADASADAEAELEMAKQQGREMVNEARAYRERVLAELSRRRELARQQIEQMLHGRDRLLQAFERARLAAVDVMAEMAPLGEPAEYVNLDPITGPVPTTIPAAAIRPVPPLPADDRDIPADVMVDVVADVVADVAPVVAEPEPEIEPVDTVDETPEPEADNAVDVIEVEIDDAVDEPAVDDEIPSNVVALFAGERHETRVVEEPADEEPAATADDGPAADDVFAKLRAARADRVAETVSADVTSVFARTPEAPDEPETELEDSAFARRDAAITPVIVAAARKLKRVLADEQNDVLATLRRNEPVTSLAALLPNETEQLDRYTAAVRADLIDAAHAGATSIDGKGKSAHSKAVNRPDTVQPAIDALAGSIVAPLRDRLDRAVAAAAGDNVSLGDSVRALYREWKNQRIDDQLEHVVHLAFGRGALAALKPGTPVCWTVDPNGPACPDAEDNALGGVVPAGEEFPTGNTYAPAHEGCRCMLAPAPR
jgi:DivIVA domain-containing protein